MDDSDALTIALANRQFVYRYLWRAFALEPDRAFLDSVLEGRTKEELELLCGKDSRAIKAHVMILDSLKTDVSTLCQLRDEYVRLFVGPTSLPSPPWESAFVGGEGLLFQASTIEVRRAYAAAGYRTAGNKNVADDHIAIEFDFMAQLSGVSLHAHGEKDFNAVEQSMSRQLRFLAEHLNAWLRQFAEQLNRNASPKISCVYPCFAVIAQEVCHADEKNIAELISLCRHKG